MEGIVHSRIAHSIFMSEVIVRFLVWLIVETIFDAIERLGYGVARFSIPFLTFGRTMVAPPPGTLIVIERWHGMHHLTDGTPVMGERLASIVGLLILAGVSAIAAALLR
jgi:hypothetical protein